MILQPPPTTASTGGATTISPPPPYSFSVTTSPPTLLPKSLFPPLSARFYFGNCKNGIFICSSNVSKTIPLRGSLLESPVLWAGRLCIYYALLKAGLAGSSANPLVSDMDVGGADLAKWFEELQSRPEKEATDKRKLVSKWHPTTKGTLRRNYRIPSKSEGRRLLKAIASLLSDDDQFRDATSHKGCQIRRESAHGESVCCNNVRALFDELPTPHVTVEITPFPAGPLSDNDYAKAEKLERVLRSGPSV
ncbi:hypothetical protein Leryth_003974 [Lithospermum erythrorhizon]|nr:hypothetical protein Leryth_003974 [Lithospermum erythrorhizon]